ncbi:hypothetical protein M407DRAFT_23016 [Tulasnella calospora MUT 4182]|uniref:Uncharacterized protein n=1 Tax=Tulasnella calospora MUT 4182 TaxID=1051891 RepID=A0A0C3QK74_9AGAM|nr:hypothetical protein M407DRAFT_23016 [Tulasnella calospora MUT 4182]
MASTPSLGKSRQSALLALFLVGDYIAILIFFAQLTKYRRLLIESELLGFLSDFPKSGIAQKRPNAGVSEASIAISLAL